MNNGMLNMKPITRNHRVKASLFATCAVLATGTGLAGVALTSAVGALDTRRPVAQLSAVGRADTTAPGLAIVIR